MTEASVRSGKREGTGGPRFLVPGEGKRDRRENQRRWGGKAGRWAVKKRMYPKKTGAIPALSDVDESH